MALGDLAGRCRVNLRNPTAQGECDVCGLWWQLDKLTKQFQWAGAALVYTGYIVCPKCLDVPFEQNRVLILPGDPQPRTDPRPSADTTGMAPAVTPGNQGFSQYVLGAPTPGNFPRTKAHVLAAVAQLSGIPTPGGVTDRAIQIGISNQTLDLLVNNPARTWVLFYNPTNAMAQISTGTAIWGSNTNLILGPGEAYFWATAQNFGAAYTGPVTLVGLTPGVPFWAWEST